MDCDRCMGVGAVGAVAGSRGSLVLMLPPEKVLEFFVSGWHINRKKRRCQDDSPVSGQHNLEVVVTTLDKLPNI